MKAKPILLVIITLIIGFVIGMLTSAQLRFNRLKPVRLYFSEERFREGFYETIKPDEKQKAEIEKILDKYAGLNSTLQNNFRKELDSNIKEMRKELDSRLTSEQLTRLREMEEKRQEMIRQGRRNRPDSTDDRSGRRGDRRDFRPRYPDDRHMPPPGEGPVPPDRKSLPPGELPPDHGPDSSLSSDHK